MALFRGNNAFVHMRCHQVCWIRRKYHFVQYQQNHWNLIRFSIILICPWYWNPVDFSWICAWMHEKSSNVKYAWHPHQQKQLEQQKDSIFYQRLYSIFRVRSEKYLHWIDTRKCNRIKESFFINRITMANPNPISHKYNLIWCGMLWFRCNLKKKK